MELRRILFLIEKVIFYDSDFLISFLLIDEVDFLKKVFSEIIIPDFVHDELTAYGTPTKIKNILIELTEEGFVKVKSIDVLSEVYVAYKSINSGNWHEEGRMLGKGESAALAFAINEDGALASNNFSDIKFYVDKYELPLLTSSFIIAWAMDNRIISKEKSVDMWKRMILENRKLPKESFLEYYDYMYKSDYDDFGHRIFDD